MGINPLLMELLENARYSYPMNEAPEEPEPTLDDAPTAEEDAPADDNAGEDDAKDDANAEENNENEEENKDEENKDENQEENSEEGGEDEFSFGSDDEEDSGPNPDGLPDPDDDGSGDEEDEAEEKNVQIEILNISALDRQLLKRKILHSFQDLRTMIMSFRTTVDERETQLEPEIRERILSELLNLHSQVTIYLTSRFQLVNYEESLQAFALFTKRFHEIIQITTGEDKHDNKKADK